MTLKQRPEGGEEMILLAEERGEIHVSKDPGMFEKE